MNDTQTPANVVVIKKISTTPTNEQKAERLDFAIAAIARRLKRSEYHKLFNEKFGIGWRRADGWMARARVHLQKASANPNNWQQQFDAAVALLEHTIATAAAPKVRLQAQEELNKLFGLYAPQRSTTDITSAGQPVKFIAITEDPRGIVNGQPTPVVPAVTTPPPGPEQLAP